MKVLNYYSVTAEVFMTCKNGFSESSPEAKCYIRVSGDVYVHNMYTHVL